MAEKVGLDARLSGVARYLSNAKAVTAANVQLGTSMTTTAAASKGMLAGFLGKAPLIAGAAVAGVGALSLKMAGDFETAFTEVITLFDASEAQIEDLRRGVLDLSATMGLDAVNSAGALYNAISKGVPPENAIAFLRENAKLAVAGVTDLGTAVELTTSVMNAFNLSSEELTRVSNVLFATVQLGGTTLDELAASLFQVAPTASGVGVAIEEIGAAMAILTARGFPTAQAATGLNVALAELTKEGTIADKAFREIAGVGFPAFVASGGTMTEALIMINSAALNSNKSVVDMFGSIEAGKAILSLTGDAGAGLIQVLASLEDSAGVVEGGFNKMNETTARQFAILSAQTKRLFIDIGTHLLPILSTFAEVVLILTGNFDSMSLSTLKARRQMLSMVADALTLTGALSRVGQALRAMFSRKAILSFLSPAGQLNAALKGAGAASDFFKGRLDDLDAKIAELELQELSEEGFDLGEALAAAGAEVPSLTDDLGELGDTVADKVTPPIVEARQTVEDLHRELERLLGMPTLESAREGLALARLRLAQLDAEKRADKERETREKQIESLEDLIDAREGEREALEEEFAGTTGVNAARRNQIQRRLAQLDKEELAAAVQIKHLEESKSAAEREVEAIQNQITELEELTTRRDLEREALRQRGILSDATVLKDNEVIRAAERMIVVIGDTTDEIRDQYGDIRSQWIPALKDAASEMGGTGGAASDLGEMIGDIGLAFEGGPGTPGGPSPGPIPQAKTLRQLIKDIAHEAGVLAAQDFVFDIYMSPDTLQKLHMLLQLGDIMGAQLVAFHLDPKTLEPIAPRQHGGFTPAGQTQLALMHGPEVTVPLHASPSPEVATILRNLIPLPFNGQATQTSGPGTGGGFQNFGTMRIEKGSDTDNAVSTLVGALR